MVELKNVSKYYNNNGVVTLGLRNINLNFDKNEIVAIVGESGSGKSTLLNVICGVDSYEEGEILFDGYETSYFNQEDMDTFRRLKVSFIYQNYNIIDSYTVLENVMFPLLINGYDKKEAKKGALELIERVGLSHRIKNRGIKLSGGEKQRCVIARALATDAPILACDEPTGNLDSKTGEEIIKLIKEVAEDKLVLIVTHNYEQVEGIATRTIKMADGEVIDDTNVNKNVCEEVKDGDIFNDEVKKIKYKTISSIAGNNLRRTPKKNIFVFLVLLVLSIIGLFLFGQSYVSSLNSENNSYSGFNNILGERAIVYKENHEKIDDSLFKDYESYSNAFYEDQLVPLRNNSIDFYLYKSVCLTAHMPYRIKKINGDTNYDENQGYLVLPTNHYFDSYTLNGIIECRSLYLVINGENIDIDVVGIATSDELDEPLLVVKQQFIDEKAKFRCFDALISLDDSITNLLVRYTDVKKPKLHLSYSNYSSLSDIHFVSKNIKEYQKTIKLDEIDIEYLSATEYLELPYDFYKTDCYELTIYTNDIDNLKKIANNNGLSVIIPAKSGKSFFSFTYIVFIVTIIFSSLVMLLLVFISYAVLQKVYQSRKKDYTIMRSLGMMRPQMAKMIRFEVVTLGFFASIVAIIVYLITFLFTKEEANMDIAKAMFSPLFLIVYILFMFLFNLLLANKFNKKLFKFSVTKTIKEVF